MTLTGKQTHWCQGSKSLSTSKCLVTCLWIARILETERLLPWESTQIMRRCIKMLSLKLTSICGISKRKLWEMVPTILLTESVLKTKLMLRRVDMEELNWVPKTLSSCKMSGSLTNRNNSRNLRPSIESSTDDTSLSTRSSQPNLTEKTPPKWNRLSSMMLILHQS